MKQGSTGVMLDRASFGPGDLDLAPLRRLLPAWREYGETAPWETAARIAGAEVVVTNKVLLDRPLLAGAPALKLVLLAATGTNNVDLAAARELGIAVSNVRDYATPAVVQHTFALMLALVTRLFDYSADVRGGAWQRSRTFCLLDHPIRELRGKVLGIVGYGVLGRGVAAVAEAFGMEVHLARRPGGPPAAGRASLGELLPVVDVLSLHCPLTPETEGLIGAAALARMKRDALLINTARGAIVDAVALADALRRGEIGGAGIDVLDREPPPDDHPLLAGDIPNLILTPHTAWASREARQRLVEQMAENLAAWLSGAPRNLVA